MCLVKKVPLLTVEPHSGLLEAHTQRGTWQLGATKRQQAPHVRRIPHALGDRRLTVQTLLALAAPPQTQHLYLKPCKHKSNAWINNPVMCLHLLCLRLKWSKSNPVSPSHTPFLSPKKLPNCFKMEPFSYNSLPFIFAGQ